MRYSIVLVLILCFVTPGLALQARRPLCAQSFRSHSGAKQRCTRFARSSNDVSSDELARLERHVTASVKSRLDYERVLKALDGSLAKANAPRRNDLMYDNEDLSPSALSQWQIASAASLVATGVTFAAFGNVVLSAFVCCFVFVVANVDDDNLGGALARILGRSAIQSVQASQPKIKAVARAVVTGDEEIMALRATVQQLQEENAALTQWKEKRLKVEESLPRYSLAELRALARQNGLAESGTKNDLLQRLVDNYEIR